MSGYQELISDPSYCGQIVCMTYPLIGNYGINRDDYESIEPAMKGLIVKEVCDFLLISVAKWIWMNSLSTKLKRNFRNRYQKANETYP